MPDLLGAALAEIARLEVEADRLARENGLLRGSLETAWSVSDAVFRELREERRRRGDAEEELADWRAKGKAAWVGGG